MALLSGAVRWRVEVKTRDFKEDPLPHSIHPHTICVVPGTAQPLRYVRHSRELVALSEFLLNERVPCLFSEFLG